jgi:peptidoglycan/LPS O-acetylase OafA/YrhL
MDPDREIKPLTGLRGIAALYVMMFHFFIGQRFTNPVTTLLAHGYLAVDVFFVLSGFVMTLTYSRLFDHGHFLSSYGKFLGRRIARVYPLYLVGTLCAFVLIRNGLLDPPHLKLSFAFLWNLLMVQAWGITESLDGPGWSISTEWAAYLLYPIILLSLVRNRLGRWIAGCLSLALLAFLALNPAAHVRAADGAALLDVHASRYGFPVLRCLAEFVLGMLAYQFSTSPAGARFAARTWIQDALTLAIILALMRPRTDLVMPLLIPPLLVGLASGGSIVARTLSFRPLEAAGRYSYSIYMIHTLLYGVLGWIHYQINAAGFKHGQTFAALVGIGLTIPLSALAYHGIEKPGRSFIRNLLEGRKVMPDPVLGVRSLSPIKAGSLEPPD